MRVEKKECDTCNGWGGEKCVECSKDYDKYEPAIGGETMTFEQRGQKLGALVDSKQAQYGDAVSASHKVMLELFPQGVPVDKLGDMRCDAVHHDGTNHYLYRAYKDGVSDEQIDNLKEKLYMGTATRADITRITRRLGDEIGRVYGWDFPQRQPQKEQAR